MNDLSRNSKSIASVTNCLISYMKHSFGKFNTAGADSIEKSFFGPCIIILTVLAWFISILFSIVGFQFVTNHTVARLSVSSPYSVCSTFSNYAFDNISSPSSNTFFSVTALLEYSDKGLNHEFFSCRGILPWKIHWFRSLPSQSPDSLNFPKKCLHDCSSLEFKLIFLRKPGLLSYIRISTWNVTLVGQYFFWNPLFPSWQQNPENPRILWFDIVFDHYKFKLILLNYRFDFFHEGFNRQFYTSRGGVG